MADGKRNDSSYRTVWRGTLVSGGLGALTGGTIAFVQNESMVRYAATMGFNCGIFGATFFVIREAFLHAQRRRNPRFALKDSQTRDYDDLLSSALAGATTGGFVSAIVRGPKSVLTGAFAFGAFCTAGQLLYTTARWYRQELILRKEHTPEPLPSKERKGFWDRVNESKWSPIKKISEEEYNERIARRREGLARATHVTDRIEATDGPTDANGTDKE